MGANGSKAIDFNKNVLETTRQKNKERRKKKERKAEEKKIEIKKRK